MKDQYVFSVYMLFKNTHPAHSNIFKQSYVNFKLHLINFHNLFSIPNCTQP